MKRDISLSNLKLSGIRIYLRNLKIKDISQRYVSWLNDPKVNRFISTRNRFQSYKSVKLYVESYKKGKDKILLGIFFRENDRHIGNLTFSRIDYKDKFAEVGICVGNKNYWRKGYAKEALDCAKKLVFNRWGFNKLEAGVCEKHKNSLKLFKKAGFRVKDRLKKRVKIGGDYFDELKMCIFKKDYEKKSKII